MLNEDSGDYHISGLGQAGDIPFHPTKLGQVISRLTQLSTMPGKPFGFWGKHIPYLEILFSLVSDKENCQQERVL